MNEQLTTPFVESDDGQSMAMRPALIIGLGGTGHRIAAHVKAAFVRALGRVPHERVHILAFDTADESISVTVEGRPVTLEPDRELFNIGHTPVGNILRNLDRQPAIAARLPNLQGLPPVMLRAGAKQVRPLGLLSLLWRFDQIERRLKTAIWELAGKEGLGQQAGTAQGINVFLCFSVVGGTGAGTFLDVAYLVRDLFHEMGTLGDFCYITGMAVLPQAFRGITGPNLIPNAMASLKELGHCMMQGGFHFQYPNGRLIDSRQPPFNLLYLLDGVDEQGYVWRGLNELCDMAATGIYLQVGSQVGRKGENDFDNLDDVLGGQTEDGEGTFCGSFGIAQLRFDGPRVADWCATRLARQVVQEGLLGEVSTAAEVERAQVWARTQPLSAAALFETLSRDEEGIPMAIDLRPPDWIARGSDTRVPEEAVRFVRDYERVRLRGEFHTRVQANRGALEASIIHDLEAWMTAALTGELCGVSSARARCRAIERLLGELSRTLGGALATVRADCTRLEEDLAAREETLLRAAGAGFLFRGRTIAGARDRYLQAAGAYLGRTWQELLAQESTALLSGLQRLLSAWTARLDNLSAALSGAAQTLEAEASRLLSDSSDRQQSTVVDLADPAYCERLFVAHRPSLEQALALLRERESLSGWLGLETGDMARRLRAAAQGPFAPVAALTVEQVIAARTEEASPTARKERLFRLATPSWNLDLTRLQDGGAGLRSLQVLGVADEAGSIMSQEVRMLVSTHDPAAIIAFLATIGAPPTALQQYPDYQRRYAAAYRTRPLHVLPQFQADGAQCKLAFALGTIFDLIFAKGTYFYYRPADPLDPPIRLDQGLENALRRFALADSLAQETMERIERQIEEIGTAAAVSRLAAYVARSPAEERSGGDEMLLELRKLVRGYADELRATLQAAGSN